jgi:14-3-3 protein epsilon
LETREKITIIEIEPGLFLFQFYHKVDKDRVLNGGPWHFENHMLVLHEVKEGYLFNQIPLNHVDMWVKIHHLPAGFMTQRIGEQMRNVIGKFIQYDASNNGFWRTYIRIRVRLGVRIPIKKELKVKNEESMR